MIIMFVSKKVYRAMCKEFDMKPIEQVEKGYAAINLQIVSGMYQLTVKKYLKKIKVLSIPEYDFSKPLPPEPLSIDVPTYWKPWMI